MVAKFKIGDPGFAWDYFGNERRQMEVTIIRVFERKELSSNQEATMLLVEAKSTINPIFYILEETHVHKDAGVTYATDPDNRKLFARFREEANANTIQRSQPKL
jgi:hypothetical protein